MARNRKRAKERRARRPQPVIGGRSAESETPSAIRHAAPDVELAEAQLALGRPELSEGGAEPEPEEPEYEELDDGAEAPLGDGDGGAGGRGGRLSSAPGGGESLPGAPVPAHRARAANRLVGFLQGSWHELQRVQWPDRRQVMQATGVVIGFVIIAGVFLGVADTLATHLVNYILNGHW